VAVKVTPVPEQTEVADAAMETVALDVRLIVTEMIDFGLSQLFIVWDT
jgi:hypothetical protein